MRAKFIVIEGMDGSGKGTQIERLRSRFPFGEAIFTREPGGAPMAERIRELLIEEGRPRSTALADLLCFFAARHVHMQETIHAAIEAGKHLFCDRFDSATFAYQIYADQRGGRDLIPAFEYLREMVVTRKPDAYIFFDLPASIAFERRKADAAQKKSDFDVMPLEYHERVRVGFLEFATRYEGKIAPKMHIIDANRDRDVVEQDVWRIVESTIHS